MAKVRLLIRSVLPFQRSRNNPGKTFRTQRGSPCWLAFLAMVAGVACLPLGLGAAILVGPLPTGTGTNAFDLTAAPPTAEWASLTIAGVAGDITTSDALDADVIANMNAANIVTALGTTSTMSPSISKNSLARLNTGG